MSEHSERQGDQEPEPIKHSDAETVSGDSDDAAKELEEDPSRNPDQEELRDIKGG